MRKTSLFILFILLLHIEVSKAQYCNTVKGNVLYYKTFDNKNNSSNIDSIEVIDIKNENNNLIITYKEYLDKSSKIDNGSNKTTFIFDDHNITYVMYIDAKIENENMKKRMLSYYPDERKIDAEKDFQTFQKRMRAEGYIRIPLHANIKKGDEIPVCKYSYKMGIVNMSISLSDGKYEGNEFIQTPIGKFNCLKVSYIIKSRIMLASETNYITEWYAEGIGLVKSETITKKGKSRSSSILVSIKKYK